MIDRVPEHRERQLADEMSDVASLLSWIGFTVRSDGDSLLGTPPPRPGELSVFYCPLVDEDGVYVRWFPGAALMAEAMAAGLGSRPARVGGAALEAMLDALERILTADGWRVESGDDAGHESTVRVLGRVDASA